MHNSIIAPSVHIGFLDMLRMIRFGHDFYMMILMPRLSRLFSAKFVKPIPIDKFLREVKEGFRRARIDFVPILDPSHFRYSY